MATVVCLFNPGVLLIAGANMPDQIAEGLVCHGLAGWTEARSRAVELLDTLSMPVAVASNAPLPQTMLSLEVTGLLEYFGFLCDAQPSVFANPAPTVCAACESVPVVISEPPRSAYQRGLT